MTAVREYKPKIKKILHICMVVKDIDKSIKTYEEVYGIGPWILGGEDEFKYVPGTLYVHGKQVDFEGRLAICTSPDLNITLELIQPLDEKSHYAEFLREHGEGMHHLAAEIYDNEDWTRTLEDRGNEAIFHGYCATPPYTEKTHCTYYDMRKDLGFICETFPDPSVPTTKEELKEMGKVI